MTVSNNFRFLRRSRKNFSVFLLIVMGCYAFNVNLFSNAAAQYLPGTDPRLQTPEIQQQVQDYYRRQRKTGQTPYLPQEPQPLPPLMKPQPFDTGNLFFDLTTQYLIDTLFPDTVAAADMPVVDLRNHTSPERMQQLMEYDAQRRAAGNPIPLREIQPLPDPAGDAWNKPPELPPEKVVLTQETHRQLKEYITELEGYASVSKTLFLGLLIATGCVLVALWSRRNLSQKLKQQVKQTEILTAVLERLTPQNAETKPQATAPPSETAT
jgi:hypothetical protein